MKTRLLFLACSIVLAGCVSAPPAEEATLSDGSRLSIDPGIFRKSAAPENVRYVETGAAGKNAILSRLVDFLNGPASDSVFSSGFTLGIFMTRELSKANLFKCEGCPLITKPAAIKIERAARIAAVYGEPVDDHEAEMLTLIEKAYADQQLDKRGLKAVCFFETLLGDAQAIKSLLAVLSKSIAEGTTKLLRKPTDGEISWYWSVISYDIDGLVLVLETDKDKFFMHFTEGKLFYIDNYKVLP